VYYKTIYDEDKDTGEFDVVPVNSDFVDNKDYDAIVKYLIEYLADDVELIYRIENKMNGNIIKINK
jgi:hypothetical protein